MDKKHILPSGVLIEAFKDFSWFSIILSNSFNKFLLIGGSPKKKFPYRFFKKNNKQAYSPFFKIKALTLTICSANINNSLNSNHSLLKNIHFSISI